MVSKYLIWAGISTLLWLGHYIFSKKLLITATLLGQEAEIRKIRGEMKEVRSWVLFGYVAILVCYIADKL